MTHSKIRLRTWLGWLLVCIGVLPLAYGLIVWEQGNFYVISDGEAYRSRQLNRDELTRYVHEYGIKSVLNLRGRNPEAAWYREEILGAESLGLRQYDYGISANRDVADHDVESILAILREAPKPILVHCKSGADRTSLVAALYLFRIECRSRDEAERQLSVRYGHFPFLWNSTIAMDRAFQRYAQTHAICGLP
jgi:protein tyrosine/serine phosphatase